MGSKAVLGGRFVVTLVALDRTVPMADQMFLPVGFALEPLLANVALAS